MPSKLLNVCHDALRMRRRIWRGIMHYQTPNVKHYFGSLQGVEGRPRPALLPNAVNARDTGVIREYLRGALAWC
jgi:hypothetical protein